MTVEAGPARVAAAQPGWLAAVVLGLAVVGVNAVDLMDGSSRWWGNFVLVPGAALMVSAVPLGVGGRARAAGGYALFCVGGLVFAVGAIVMTTGMGRLWPLMIALPCLTVVGTVRWLPAEPSGRAAHLAVLGVAVLGVLLSGVLLALRAGAVDLPDRWWGGFMVAAGVTLVASTLPLRRDRSGYRLSAGVLLVGLGVGAVLAGLRELLWR